MNIQFILGVVLLVPLSTTGRAAPVNWSVDSGQSWIQVSGKAMSGGITLTLTPQGAGADKAAVAGTIGTDLTPGSIDVVSSNLALLNSGSWSPLPGGAIGTAPANWGMQAFGQLAAIRNGLIDIDTPTLPLTGGPTLYSFDAIGSVLFAGGVADYRFAGQPGTSNDIVGSNGSVTGTGATISIVGNLATLTLPFSAPNVNIVLDDFNTVSTTDDITGLLNFNGLLVATAIVPEPPAFMLSASGVAILASLCYRRRCRRNGPIH